MISLKGVAQPAKPIYSLSATLFTDPIDKYQEGSDSHGSPALVGLSCFRCHGTYGVIQKNDEISAFANVSPYPAALQTRVQLLYGDHEHTGADFYVTKYISVDKNVEGNNNSVPALVDIYRAPLDLNVAAGELDASISEVVQVATRDGFPNTMPRRIFEARFSDYKAAILQARAGG